MKKLAMELHLLSSLVSYITTLTGLAGEMLSVAAPCLDKQIHPTKIIAAFRQALEDITTAIDTKLRFVRRISYNAF